MVNTRSRSPRPSQGPHKTKMQIKGKQATTRSPLTPEIHTSRKIDAANVEIQPTWKGLLALQKITYVRTVINLGTSQACASYKVNKNKLTTSIRNQRHIS